MTDREAAWCRCPECHHRFAVLADEQNSHPCPRCGFLRYEDKDEDTEEWSDD